MPAPAAGRRFCPAGSWKFSSSEDVCNQNRRRAINFSLGRAAFLEELAPDAFVQVIQQYQVAAAAERRERCMAHYVHDGAARQLVLIRDRAEVHARLEPRLVRERLAPDAQPLGG